MLMLRCARCRKKLFRYLKIGAGRVLRCHKQRITHDYTLHDGKVVCCRCGHAVGQDVGSWLKMKKGSFTITGRKL